MRLLRPALTALLMGAALPALIAPAFAQTCACPPTSSSYSGPVIQAEEPPPPLPVYEQPAIPAPGYIWTPGYWAWNNYDYYWVPGVWVPPPQPSLLWTPAYWAFVGGAYLFHQGYWGPHVGFYGGVNYGFGYNGLGYEGGRWEGGRFAYNTTVNNFGGVHVTNVYSQNVTVLPGVSRVSYNGGPGGVALKPTPEQERLTTEEHVRSTQQQVTQARTASMEPTQFHENNKGKPAVAATQRSGELKGPGVVPAKAAGTAEVQPAQAPNAAPARNGAQRLRPGEKPPAEGGEPAKAPETSAPASHQRPGAAEKPGTPGTTPAGKPNRAQEKAPEEKAPGGPLKSEGAGGPPRLNAEPNREAKPPEQKAPGEPPKPEGAEAPARPNAQPQREAKPSEAPRPKPAVLAPVGERPRPEAIPGGGVKGPAGAAEHKPQRPEGRAPECGRPGEPPCR